MPKPNPLLVLAVLALTAGCNKSGDNARATTSEVLEGTISDNMIPVDTLTSEPPIAEPTEGAKDAKGKPKGKAGAPVAAGDSSADSHDAGDAPADSASPAAAAPD